jgi:broad specificity phosphatase PhoE
MEKTTIATISAVLSYQCVSTLASRSARSLITTTTMTLDGKRCIRLVRLLLLVFWWCASFKNAAYVSSFVIVNFNLFGSSCPSRSSSSSPSSSVDTSSISTRLHFSSKKSSSDSKKEVLVEQISDQYRLWKQGDVGGVPPQVQRVDAMPQPPLHELKLKHQYYLLRHGQSTANVDEVISSDRAALAYTNQHGLTELGWQQGRDAARQLVDLLLLQPLQPQSASSDHDDDSTITTPAAAAAAAPSTVCLKAGDTVVFVSSPFARARQTAQACLDALLQDETLQSRIRHAVLGGNSNGNVINILPNVYYHDLLLERSFGRLDNEAIYTYAYVWPLDKYDILHTAFDVESVAAVCTRFQQCIVELERADFPSCHSSHAEQDNDKTSSSSTAARASALPTPTTSTTHVVCVSHADVLQIAQLYAANAPNIGEFSSFRFANGEIRRMILNGGVASLPAPPRPLPAPRRGTGM